MNHPLLDVAGAFLKRMCFDGDCFAASGEAPDQMRCREKGKRNFEFLRGLIEQGQRSGELDGHFSSDELTMGIFGQLNSYVMIRLLVPDCPLNRQTARQIVRLFLNGAANPLSKKNGAVPDADTRIATAAYYLWENEGRPHGRDKDHWFAAQELLSRT